jgi:DNA-binding CsgD family transcriptional regulator
MLRQEERMKRLGAEEQAVIDVIQRENAAFWMQDEEAFARCHAPRSDTLRWGYWQAGGLFKRQGADNIVPAALAHMRSLKRPLPEFAHAEMANLVVHVSDDMAWACFDRLMPYVPEMFGYGPNGTIHLLFILERIDGQWLIVATTVLDAHLGEEVVVRVAADGKIAWTSHRAAARLEDDPSFVVRNGRLRLRLPRLDARLQSAIAWAAHLGGPLMPRRGAVPLVIENAPGATRVCWVLAEDGGFALVMLDDIRPISERIEHAAQVFGLSPSQSRVALAVSEGRSLAEFARQSNITLNSARTHLRRVFEKTGVSSQPALVASLLSLTPPR